MQNSLICYHVTFLSHEHNRLISNWLVIVAINNVHMVFGVKMQQKNDAPSCMRGEIN